MTASATERGQRGVSRVLTKLDNSIEAGNYYEAHQMYRTLYFRYTAQRKYDECLDLLYNGSLKLVSKNQDTSAADLGLLIVDTLEKRGVSNDSDDVWIERLSKIIQQLNASTVERETLINRSIKWSGDMSGNSLGHPKMHKSIAVIFWAEGNTEQARHHYLLCREGHLCGRILIKINETKGYTSELDLFIVQAVLQQLCLKDRKTAEDTFVSYTSQHPQILRKDMPFKQPLLNFIYFLFRSIDMGRLDCFRSLCDLYKPSLNRDPSFDKYLVKIGVLFFGAAPPVSAVGGGGLMGGMFGDLFTRLFQGFDDDDYDQNADDQLRDGGGREGVDGNHANELD